MKTTPNNNSERREPKISKYTNISENVFIRWILDNVPDTLKLMTLRKLKDNATVEKNRAKSESEKERVQQNMNDIDEAIANLTDKFKEEVRKKSDKYKS